MKRLTGIGAALAVVLLIAAGMLRPDWRYLAGEAVSCLGRANPLQEQDAGTLELTSYTPEELREKEVFIQRNLLLINDEHHLSDSPDLVDYEQTGVLMDALLEEPYRTLSQEVEQRYHTPLYIRSAYRSREEQIQTIQEDGGVAAQVDASEHQAGLALDVYVPGYAGRALIKSEAGQYINSNCWEYGFIIRYPWYGKGKTGIPYEPWHLRYVGMPHAEIISENALTLEQYIQSLEPGRYYRYGDWLITRQKEGEYLLPETWREISASQDNLGYIVFTILE